MVIPHAKSSTLSGRTLSHPRPKPAKELALPPHGLTGIMHETLTSCIVYLADSANIEGVAINELCRSLTGSCFESPNDTIHVTVSGHAATETERS